MATLPARRSSGRNLTVVNPTREFEDIYDRPVTSTPTA